MSDRILFVDDDPSVLDAYQRTFRKEFTVGVATSGEEALALLERQGPYAVVVSDMQMPGMDGIRLLAEVRARAPDTLRMMLTGKSDLQVAMDAVNEGAIFRFLTKPCPAGTMGKALTAGVTQYYLVTTERELLQKTLSGAVKVLAEVLALVNPTAFGRAQRVHRLVGQLADKLAVAGSWQIDIAAMLSQLGCVTLPEETLAKVCAAAPLAPQEWTQFNNHPSVGAALIANIPRLEDVAAII